MRTFKARYRSELPSVAVARRAIGDFARVCGFHQVALDDIESAVGEALANAVEHGHRDHGWFRVTCEFEAEALTIEVKDLGGGFDFHQPVCAERTELRPRGFGRTIMRACMDDVHYADGGTRVRLIKRVFPADDDPSLRRVRWAGLLGRVFRSTGAGLDTHARNLSASGSKAR
jgi:anti-sigma regulatory factor (Ser/Thr protein kinase)